jgi:hypothetical protein
MPKIFYRELKKYKYQLENNYFVNIGIIPDKSIFEPANGKEFLRLEGNGVLTIFAGYAWDGPSGPTIDSKNFLRGSLVHDAIYQLIRQKHLPESYRERADQILYEICLEDGMSKFRAKYVYTSVKLFGASSAKPTGTLEHCILEAP